jgi:hypothetical protein
MNFDGVILLIDLAIPRVLGYLSTENTDKWIKFTPWFITPSKSLLGNLNSVISFLARRLHPYNATLDRATSSIFGARILPTVSKAYVEFSTSFCCLEKQLWFRACILSVVPITFHFVIHLLDTDAIWLHPLETSRHNVSWSSSTFWLLPSVNRIRDEKYHPCPSMICVVIDNILAFLPTQTWSCFG